MFSKCCQTSLYDLTMSCSNTARCYSNSLRRSSVIFYQKSATFKSSLNRLAVSSFLPMKKKFYICALFNFSLQSRNCTFNAFSNTQMRHQANSTRFLSLFSMLLEYMFIYCCYPISNWIYSSVNPVRLLLAGQSGFWMSLTRKYGFSLGCLVVLPLDICGPPESEFYWAVWPTKRLPQTQAVVVLETLWNKYRQLDGGRKRLTCILDSRNLYR